MIRLAVSGAHAAFVDKISYFYRHLSENNNFVARHNAMHRYEGEYRAWCKFYSADLAAEQFIIVDKMIAEICFKIGLAYYKNSDRVC